MTATVRRTEVGLIRAGARLAFRVEGEFVNAYLADLESMAGAEFLGSCRENLLQEDPVLWDHWRKIFKDWFERRLAERGLRHPEWTEKRAPENDRGNPQ